MRAEFLIVGQGLAGTALAWRLQERGRSFLIVDPNDPLTCSKAAAGLVTPITGLRLTLNWRYAEMHPEAVRFYRHKERLLGRKFYFPRPVAWLFKNEREREIWARRLVDENVRTYISMSVRQPIVSPEHVDDSLGGFQMKHAGFLDTGAYLEASRQWFESRGAWQNGRVDEDDLTFAGHGAEWKGERFGTVVFCQGWHASSSHWFSWLPYGSAQGTILTLNGDSGDRRKIVNRGCWIVPRPDGTLRAGSSFDLHFDEPHTPDPASLDGLVRRLRALLKTDFQIKSSHTAVRPIIKHCKAAIGRHPAQPRLAFLNGLGSKGVLRSPYLARRLVEHLLDEVSLDGDIDLQANHL